MCCSNSFTYLIHYGISVFPTWFERLSKFRHWISWYSSDCIFVRVILVVLYLQWNIDSLPEVHTVLIFHHFVGWEKECGSHDRTWSPCLLSITILCLLQWMAKSFRMMSDDYYIDDDYIVNLPGASSFHFGRHVLRLFFLLSFLFSLLGNAVSPPVDFFGGSLRALPCQILAPSLPMQQALNQWRAIASPFICAGVSDCQRLKLFVPVRVLFKTAVGADYVNFQVVLVVEQTMAFVPLAQVRRLLGRAGLPLRQLHHHLYCKCTKCLFWFSLYFFLFRTSFLVTIQHDLAKEQQIFGIHLPD